MFNFVRPLLLLTVILPCLSLITLTKLHASENQGSPDATQDGPRPLPRPWEAAPIEGLPNFDSDAPDFLPRRCLDKPIPQKISNCEKWEGDDLLNARLGYITNPFWLHKSEVEQGQILLDMATKIVEAHNFRYCKGTVHEGAYSPRILVCKMYNESNFRPQVKSSFSTAGGVSGVTRGALNYAVERREMGFYFNSRVPGYAHLNNRSMENGEPFYEAMKTSLALQVEAGLFVMHLKNHENMAGRRCTGIRDLLQDYFSRGSDYGVKYSNAIYSCADCIKSNDNKVTQKCLGQARVKQSKEDESTTEGNS